MFEHLLVPLDGSRLAEAALPAALRLATAFSADITLVQVIQPPYMASPADGAAYFELLLEMKKNVVAEARSYLAGLEGSLRQQGYRVHRHLTEGHPVAPIILRVARDLGADTIVMSTHGRGGLSRWVYGSVADRLLRLAEIPVVLVRATGAAVPELPREIAYPAV